MKNNFIKKIFFTAIVMCFSMTIWANGLELIYRFKIVDQNGNPVRNAQITATSNNTAIVVISEFLDYTDESGIGEIRVSIKEGIGTCNIVINVKKGDDASAFNIIFTNHGEGTYSSNPLPSNISNIDIIIKLNISSPSKTSTKNKISNLFNQLFINKE